MAFTTSFVGVDADAIGNGDSDETLPLDTWLQRRIQANNQTLLNVKSAVCWNPVSGSADDFTTHAGIRPYCAFEWHSVWTGWVYVYPEQTDLDLTFAYHADTLGSSGTSAGNVLVGVTCSDGTDTRRSPTTMAVTYSSGIQTGHQTITVDLVEKVRQGGVMRVTIWEKSSSTNSAVPTTIGSAGTGATSVLRHKEPYTLADTATSGTPGFFDPNSSGTPPDGSSLEGMYVYGGTHSEWSSATATRYDLLYAANNSTAGTVAGTLQQVIAAANAIDSNGTAYKHCVLLVRAVFFRPVFAAGAGHIPRKYFSPIREFGAAEAAKQLLAVRRAYFQPSVAYIGPRGKLGDTGYSETDLHKYAANGYAVHWPTVMGNFDGVDGGDEPRMLSESIYLRTENPDLELRCLWVSLQHGASWGYHQVAKPESQQKFRSEEGRFDKVDVTAQEGPGSATWTMTASLEQIADVVSATGDWDTNCTEYGAISASVKIPVYGADARASSETQPPVLRGIDGHQQTGKTDTSDPGFWFKEGSLFGADMQVVHETRHRMRVESTTQTQTLLPFRFRLDMELSSFDKPVVVGTSVTSADLRLMLVGCTIIEIPREP